MTASLYLTHLAPREQATDSRLVETIFVGGGGGSSGCARRWRRSSLRGGGARRIRAFRCDGRRRCTRADSTCRRRRCRRCFASAAAATAVACAMAAAAASGGGGGYLRSFHALGVARPRARAGAVAHAARLRAIFVATGGAGSRSGALAIFVLKRRR